MPPPTALATAPSLEASHVEFEFGDADFNRVRALIRERAGIHLNDGKQAMVYSRLSRRLRESGHRSVAAYLQALESGSGPAAAAEWEQFVNSLTTNLTSFFRESHHFDELAAALRERSGRPLRIWCSAASTGEEPYSIAMVVNEVLGTQADVRILATDIDTGVLATAAQAVYPVDARGLSPERLRSHCQRGTGSRHGFMRIKPECTQRVEFKPFNLMQTSYSSLGAPFDLVFCRNVMIYFDAATQREVLKRMHAVMNRGSLLFVGHSENFSDARTHFKLRGKTVYEHQ